MGFWVGFAGAFSRHQERLERRREFKQQLLLRQQEIVLPYLLDGLTAVNAAKAEKAEVFDKAQSIGLSLATIGRLDSSGQLEDVVEDAWSLREDGKLREDWDEEFNAYVSKVVEESGGSVDDYARGVKEVIAAMRDGDDSAMTGIRIVSAVTQSTSYDDLVNIALTANEAFAKEKAGLSSGADTFLEYSRTSMEKRESTQTARIKKAMNNQLGTLFGEGDGSWHHDGENSVYVHTDGKGLLATENALTSIVADLVGGIYGGVDEETAQRVVDQLLLSTYTKGMSPTELYQNIVTSAPDELRPSIPIYENLMSYVPAGAQGQEAPAQPAPQSQPQRITPSAPQAAPRVVPAGGLDHSDTSRWAPVPDRVDKYGPPREGMYDPVTKTWRVPTVPPQTTGVVQDPTVNVPNVPSVPDVGVHSDEAEEIMKGYGSSLTPDLMNSP